jgi:hypothetical protein
MNNDDLIEKINELEDKIDEMNFYIQCLHDLIPIKYKKKFYRKNENPFYSTKNIDLPTKDDYEAAKKRMAALLE